jgi:RNA polymerase sigma-70 factor (ECF subfamily)
VAGREELGGRPLRRRIDPGVWLVPGIVLGHGQHLRKAGPSTDPTGSRFADPATHIPALLGRRGIRRRSSGFPAAHGTRAHRFHATMSTLTETPDPETSGAGTDEQGAAGSAGRFEALVLPEVEVMLRVARSVTGNSHDAEDLVQETMMRAYRAIAGFDGRHPRAWLLTILRNAEVNRHRRRRPSLLTEAQVNLPDPVADSGDTAEDAALSATFDEAVETAFRALSPDFREVVELVDLGGLSYSEAAEVAGIPEGTVMSRLHRARRRMRKSLDDARSSAGEHQTRSVNG